MQHFTLARYPFLKLIIGSIIALGCLLFMPSAFAQKEAPKINFKTVDLTLLNTDYAFKRVKGDGTRTLYLFSDIDCPYCVKLEHVFNHIDNITIYTFLLPLPSIHPEGPQKSALIWCADQPGQAWEHFFQTQELPAPQTSCNPAFPSFAIRTLATKLGIGEEPALIFEDGRMAAGQPFIQVTWNAEVLESLLERAQKRKTLVAVP